MRLQDIVDRLEKIKKYEQPQRLREIDKFIKEMQDMENLTK
jgi:hypothetical protein